MKRCPGWVALAVLLQALAVSGQAQVEIACRMDHTTFIQNEPLLVTLEIRNAGPRNLVLSGPGQNVRLEFDIQHSAGSSADRADKEGELLPERVVIEPLKSRQITMDLGKFYNVRLLGQYKVQARIDGEKNSFLSRKFYFDVRQGLEIQRLLAGAPDQPDVLIVYSLRKVTRSDGEHLFLREESEDGKTCYGVLSLGRLIDLFPPMLQADATGQVHVLHQSGPAQYSHTIVAADGTPISQETYTSQFPARLIEGPGGILAIKVSTPPADLNPPPAAADEPVSRKTNRKDKRE